MCTLGYLPRRPSRPCLRPARCIPLGVLCSLGYIPRGLLVLACVLLAVSRWGGGVPDVIRSSGWLLSPPTDSPNLRPPRLHFLQLCHLVIQSTRTTPFCRPNTRPLKCSSRSPAGIHPSGASRPCLCPASSIPLGVLCTLGYVPRRPSRPCLCPASSIPLGVLCTLGYVPRRPSRPCLCPASSIPLGVLCTLGYVPQRLPHPPQTHPTLGLLGCIFCNSVTLLHKAHALPHSAGLKNTP